MANTTNFNWETPDDTDLVKDGALAMRTLGNAIDTSLVDLKGGTTGQILSKNSNTDMDFTWIANDQGDITAVTAGTGISGGGTTGSVTITNDMATTITAKGDIVAGTGNATYDNLAAGSNGDTLVADSAATTGLRWTSTPNASNPVINSAFDIWARGTSSTTSGGYTADRWYCANNTQSTYSREATGDTTNLPNIQYCMRLSRNNGGTNTGGTNAIYNFETADSIPFAGKTVTLSFYARKGANLSSSFNVYLHSGTGTDQNYWSGFTGSATPIDSGNLASTVTSSWVRYSYSGTVAATATQLAIQIAKGNTGTAGAADYIEVTGVMLNVGSVALPYRRYSNTIQGELAACQRYYYRQNANQVYSAFGQGSADSTTVNQALVNLPVTMRVAPTSIDYASLANYDGVTVTAVTTAALGTSLQSQSVAYVSATVASGLTQYRAYKLIANNTTSAYIGFSAEL